MAPDASRAAHPAEIAWFAALCDDDYEFLGVPDPGLHSSFAHCADIAEAAEQAGFDNILLPSGYELGIDSVAFAAAIAPRLRSMRALLAVRCGEMWPPQLARQLATVDSLMPGRLTVNIISSDLPGQPLESAARYQRTLEAMQIVRGLLAGETVDFRGEWYDLKVAAPRICRERAMACADAGVAPSAFYFGGLSEHARDVAAQAADVYLMWPDTEDEVASIVADMRGRAASYGRTLRFGYRVHVVVRDTETEARAAAERLISRLDADTGAAIRARSLDSESAGVRRQAELREGATGDGYAEPHLWTGIGRARSGCGAAIVGDPDQVAAKLERYRTLGIDAFILSGYPHRDECIRFGRDVLPRLDHGPLVFPGPAAG